MQLFLSTTNNPYFNIAAEEYFIRHFDSEIIFLYRNAPSVILGKHQNAFAEIDVAVVKQYGIKVVRRVSGGGTVYHDMGNLNFAHIKSVEGHNKVDFHRFLEPLVDALKLYGVETEIGPRNNVLLEGKKITGTACHTIKNRVMHHGTLLYKANLDLLNTVLTPHNKLFESKAVKSVSSTVTNITDHLQNPNDIAHFEQYLAEYFLEKGATMLELNEQDEANIQKMMDEKFSQWEWNYAYSPKFTFVWKERLLLYIEKGIIQKVEALAEQDQSDDLVELVGQSFRPELFQ